MPRQHGQKVMIAIVATRGLEEKDPEILDLSPDMPITHNGIDLWIDDTSGDVCWSPETAGAATKRLLICEDTDPTPACARTPAGDEIAAFFTRTAATAWASQYRSRLLRTLHTDATAFDEDVSDDPTVNDQLVGVKAIQRRESTVPE